MKSYRYILPIIIIFLVSCGRSGIPDDEIFTSLGFTPVDPGLELPDFTFSDSDGSSKTPDDFNGSVVLLNFWATWCPPCRAEIPSMSVLYKELGSADFEIVAVNVGEQEELVKAFSEEFDVGFPVYFDPDGQAATALGVNALPTSLLLDRKGGVRALIAGPYEWDNQQFVTVLEEWVR